MAEHNQSLTSRWLWSGLALVASIALLLFGVFQGDESWALSREGLWALLVAQPLVVLSLVILPAWRLKLLLPGGVRFRKVVQAVGLSVLLFKLLPARLSDGVKPLYLSAVSGIPVSRSLTAIAFERLLDIVCVGILVLLAALFAAPSVAQPLRILAYSLCSLAIAGAAGVVMATRMPTLVTQIVARLPFAWLRRTLLALVTAVRDVASIPRLLMPALLSVVIWTLSYSVYLVFIAAAGRTPLAVTEILIVFVFATAGFAFAVAPGGFGTYEAAVIVSLKMFGYSYHDAIAMALLLHLTNIIPAIPLAVWALWDDPIDLDGLLKRMRVLRLPNERS